jgi:hypothetical protein
LVKPFYWKRFLTVYGQIPVSEQIFLMNLDPCDDQLVLVGRQSTCQKRFVKKIEYTATFPW